MVKKSLVSAHISSIKEVGSNILGWSRLVKLFKWQCFLYKNNTNVNTFKHLNSILIKICNKLSFWISKIPKFEPDWTNLILKLQMGPPFEFWVDNYKAIRWERYKISIQKKWIKRGNFYSCISLFLQWQLRNFYTSLTGIQFLNGLWVSGMETSPALPFAGQQPLGCKLFFP